MPNAFLVQCIASASAANEHGQFDLAVQWCQRALNLDPSLPEAWYNLGLALRGCRRASEARVALLKTAALTHDNPDAQNSVGLQLTELGAYPEAEQCLERSLALAPSFAFAHSNLGRLREKQGALDAAEAAFRKAIELQPGLAPAYVNLAGILNRQDDARTAADVCRQAIRLSPASAHAWSNLSAALCRLKDYDGAEDAARSAVTLAPELAPAWENLCAALCARKSFESAVEAGRKAAELDSRSAVAWAGLGAALAGLKKLEEAATCYSKSLELDPRTKFIPGELLSVKMPLCEWRSFEMDLGHVVERVRNGRRAANPFLLLSVTSDLTVQRRAAETFVAFLYPERVDLGTIPRRPADRKIRVGYYSADFRNHPVSALMAEVFELHDRTQFETVAFAFGRDSNDELGRRVGAAFDHFIDVRAMSDREVAERSRNMGIDIAVDLGGFTEDCRTDIFALRAAPIQVSYLGYLGTMGAPYIDYLIADPTIIPEESKVHYSEKIAYLPSYQANDRKRVISDRIFTRAELGLPDEGFIFCCFNNSYKILPGTFASWMRLLRNVEGAVLFLLADNDKVVANLRREAENWGIDPARLVFAGRLPTPEYLARYRVADLFLDTFPYNAGTTASDALWAGLPVLTRTGDSFASRVAASLLRAIGLPELIATTDQEYEALAIQMAHAPERLSELKRRLQENRSSGPLFDTPRFVTNLETLYQRMYKRYQAGLEPDHIYVNSDGT